VHLRRVAVIGLILAIAGAAGGYYYVYTQRHPSTSDSYVGMHVAQIAAQVSGPVKSVDVRSHQAVAKGALLFNIDPAPFELAVQQAEAHLEQAREKLAAADAQVAAAQGKVEAAQATLDEVQRHSARIHELVAAGTASKDEGDVAERALNVARDTLATAKADLAAVIASRGLRGETNAAVKAAEAALSQARLDLRHTRIVAPADGVVGEVDLRPGSYVRAGRPLFALVETGEVWVDANFKETDLMRIRPGQAARVTVDLQPGKTFKGKVVSLSPASGTAFSLLPPENATGNWVKVTQRFPVRIRILDTVADLRVGASSEVTVDTTRPSD
jgi:membrane fusion protein (multidrug efflux system)